MSNAVPGPRTADRITCPSAPRLRVSTAAIPVSGRGSESFPGMGRRIEQVRLFFKLLRILPIPQVPATQRRCQKVQTRVYIQHITQPVAIPDEHLSGAIRQSKNLKKTRELE